MSYTTDIVIILLACTICVSTIFDLIKPKKVSSQPMMISDYDAMVVFLDNTIERCTMTYIKTHLHAKDYINNITFEESLKEISIEIVTALSFNYKKNLSMFFSEQGLWNYIVIDVKDYLIDYSTRINKMKE